MRTLIVIASLEAGGAQRAVATLSRLWTLRGDTVCVVTTASGETDFFALDRTVSRVALGLDRPSGNIIAALWNNARRLLELRHQIRAFEPDVVVGLMPPANVLAAIATVGLGCVVIGSERVHPPLMPRDVIRDFARKWTYRALDGVVALSHETAEWLRAHTKVRKVRVIQNAVEWPVESALPVVAPDTVCHPQRKILLAAGRLESQKGFVDLVDVFSQIHSQQPEWDLVIVGEGQLRSEIESSVITHNLRGRVYLPGRVGNIGDWYARASLYVMSSLFEGFPNTLVEAMACGVPAVSYDCDTGPRDIIRNGVDGILVPVNDKEALGKALVSLMGRPDVRQQMSARAIDVRHRFSPQSIMQQWQELFEEFGCARAHT